MSADCQFCGNGPQLKLALAACRSIRFALANAERHRGEFNLLDLEAAGRLAEQALGPQKNTKKGACAPDNNSPT